jgi:aminoglycoside 6'-N-acetyltransferase I
VSGVLVRAVEPTDVDAWLRMRCALWPDGSEDEHRGEIALLLAGKLGDPAAAFLAEEERGRAVGFAELSVRPCAEGCRTTRVAYLEGWYVMPEARMQGVGRALVAAAEEWGRAQGCTEFASDTAVDNTGSAAAHLALGFEEAGLVRCFRKELR